MLVAHNLGLRFPVIPVTVAQDAPFAEVFHYLVKFFVLFFRVLVFYHFIKLADVRVV